MNDWEAIVIPGVTGLFGSLITWLFGRKKEKIEVESSEITNVQEAIKIWREMATDLKSEVAELKIKVDSLTTEIHNLRSENIELRAKLDENQPNKPKRTKPNKEV